MENNRLQQPLKPDYASALGTATFCFAICEWNAVYCAERIHPSSLHTFIKNEITAGKIAKKLLNLTRNMPKVAEREELIKIAMRFDELVVCRNTIIHGKPCTGPSGESRLSSEKVFEIKDLEEAADAFSACSMELNRLLHGFLSTYTPV